MQYHSVLQGSQTSTRGLPLVPLTNPDEDVRPLDVQFIEDGSITELLQGFWDKGK